MIFKLWTITRAPPRCFVLLQTCVDETASLQQDAQRGRKTLLPLRAVFVAELADFIVVCKFPHQHVILPWHASGTPGHAEQAILEVGTPCAVSTTLEVKDDVYNSLLLW